jgi:hypothetical protein
MNKNCIVSFANQRGRYVQNMARLSESLRNNFDGDFLGFIGESSIGAPPHEICPYGFKIHAFRSAQKAGYNKVLYVDSSCFAIKNVQPCFDEIEKDGFFFQYSGHTANEWMNDRTLNYYGITREDAREIPLIGNAGMLGLDFSKELPNTFFNRWEKAMQDGMFVGKWDNKDFTESSSEECKGFRHDMQNAIILNDLGVLHFMKKGDEWLQYSGLYDETSNQTIIWKAQG